MKSKISKVIALALLSVSQFSVFAQSEKPPISIGAVLSLTGPLAVAGLPERDGVRLAIDSLNASGGVQGRRLELVIEDDGSNPDTALSKANALVHTRNVKALLGGTGLAATVAMGGVTSAGNIPQISYTGLGPAVEKERRCVFHLTPAQDLNARGMLEYAAKALNVKQVGVLHDAGFGQAVMASLNQLAGSYGIEIVGVEKFEIGATELSTQAAKLRSSKPQAVLIATSNPAAFRAVKQLRLNVPVVATHISAPYDSVKAMGDAAEGVTFADYLVAEDPLPHQKAFVSAFQSKFGRMPKNFDAAGYDSVYILARGLQQAGPDASGEKICGALQQRHEGQMATYDFSAPDMGGLSVTNFVYSTYSNGKFSRVPFKGGR
jgi:branched-chain amino acid transport system substrate-binding protein